MGYIGSWLNEGFCRVLGIGSSVILSLYILLNFLNPKLQEHVLGEYLTAGVSLCFAVFFVLPTMYLFSHILIWLFGRDEN